MVSPTTWPSGCLSPKEAGAGIETQGLTSDALVHTLLMSRTAVGPSFGRGQDLPGTGEMGHVLVWLGKTEGAGKLWGEGCKREQVKPLL